MNFRAHCNLSFKYLCFIFCNPPLYPIGQTSIACASSIYIIDIWRSDLYFDTISSRKIFTIALNGCHEPELPITRLYFDLFSMSNRLVCCKSVLKMSMFSITCSLL